MYGTTQSSQVSMNQLSYSRAMSCSSTLAWVASTRSKSRSG